MNETALKLPMNYVSIACDEMEYLDGGSWSLANSRGYLDKDIATARAMFLVRLGYVTGMTELDVAKEIFAHAVLYYTEEAVSGLGISNDILTYIKEHANPIDIADGGDVWYRKAAYNVIWAGVPG